MTEAMETAQHSSKPRHRPLAAAQRCGNIEVVYDNVILVCAELSRMYRRVR